MKILYTSENYISNKNFVHRLPTQIPPKPLKNMHKYPHFNKSPASRDQKPRKIKTPSCRFPYTKPGEDEEEEEDEFHSSHKLCKAFKKRLTKSTRSPIISIF